LPQAQDVSSDKKLGGIQLLVFKPTNNFNVTLLELLSNDIHEPLSRRAALNAGSS
jgi:hypothetical protein